jgi:ribosome assembly protein 1
MSGTSSIFGTPAHTRLVTIAAHVDHGKTTLADNLIESNGLISERAAGTLRYLDSDPEEQRRGITMRTSAIGLSHRHCVPPLSAVEKEPRNMIVHLLDSPGHTDFSREVSSSMLACDGAILVVDAVEGMGARTQQVFRETETYQLTPILVINKIDRLHTDLCLSSTEAYLRIRALLETVNAAAASMVNSSQQLRQGNVVDQDWLEQQEKLWTFDPASGNVIFASALFGWGFTVQSLCHLW